LAQLTVAISSSIEAWCLRGVAYVRGVDRKTEVMEAARGDTSLLVANGRFAPEADLPQMWLLTLS